MDKAIQNCFDNCPSSKCLGTGAAQSRADFNIRTEEVLALWESGVKEAKCKRPSLFVFQVAKGSSLLHRHHQEASAGNEYNIEFSPFINTFKKRTHIVYLAEYSTQVHMYFLKLLPPSGVVGEFFELLMRFSQLSRSGK